VTQIGAESKGDKGTAEGDRVLFWLDKGIEV